MPAADVPSLPPRKRRVFIALTVLLPFMLLGAGEGVARLLGRGGHEPVIKIIGDLPGGKLATTYIPGAASYFDASKGTPGSMGQYVFLQPKPRGTIRVVLAGESAIQGYPQPMAFANSAFLTQMLGDVWPGRPVEVINLGTTAVASFPVLDMLTQALEFEPDLAVVYVGHNEFYGAYGVASLQSAGNTPGAIRFHRWFSGLGLVQLISGLGGPDANAPGGALMQVMAANAHIRPDDPLRARAAGNLKAHVAEMIERCQQRGVLVIVCTLASNERDLAPIGTPDDSALDPMQRDRFKSLLGQARRQLKEHPADAAALLEQAVQLASKHAVVEYLLGKAYWSAGERARAVPHFRRAVDLDPMPWRAPAESIEAIRQAATDQGATLCDVQQLFRDASSNGCIGWELMDDHVHFSLEGQALLARSIVGALVAGVGPLKVEQAVFDALPDWPTYARRLGENEYDDYAVAHGLREVFSVPFMRASNPEAYDRWDGRCKSLAERWPTYLQQVAQEWQDPTLHSVVRRPLSGFVGRAMIREKAYASAGPLLEVAARCVPLYSSWSVEYTYFALLCQYEQAGGALAEHDQQVAAETLERAEFLLAHGVGSPGLLQRFCGRLLQLQNRWPESIPRLLEARKHLWEMEKVACDAALIEAYVRTGQAAEARALAEDGVQHAGAFAVHYRKFLASIPER